MILQAAAAIALEVVAGPSFWIFSFPLMAVVAVSSRLLVLEAVLALVVAVERACSSFWPIVVLELVEVQLA